MEEEIAETGSSLDEKEEESEERKEDLPSNDSNSLTLTLYDYPPCVPKEEESYIVEFAPTTINKDDCAYVESNNFMHVAHDENVSCDSYIVNFIHDATESYYERGKHGCMHLNNIKFPLFMLKILKLHLFCLHMLVALCYHDLFLYKIPFHRKWVRIKCVSYLIFDAVFVLQLLFHM